MFTVLVACFVLFAAGLLAATAGGWVGLALAGIVLVVALFGGVVWTLLIGGPPAPRGGGV